MRQTMQTFMVTVSVVIVTPLTEVTPQTVTSHAVTPKAVTLHAVIPHDVTHLGLTPHIARALSRSGSAAKPSARFSEDSDMIPKRMRRPALKRVGKLLRLRNRWLILITVILYASGFVCLVTRKICKPEQSSAWKAGAIAGFVTGIVTNCAICLRLVYSHLKEERQYRRKNAIITKMRNDACIQIENLDAPQHPDLAHVDNTGFHEPALSMDNLDAPQQPELAHALRNDNLDEPEQQPRNVVITTTADVHDVRNQQAGDEWDEAELHPPYNDAEDADWDDASSYHTGRDEFDNLDD